MRFFSRQIPKNGNLVKITGGGGGENRKKWRKKQKKSKKNKRGYFRKRGQKSPCPYTLILHLPLDSRLCVDSPPLLLSPFAPLRAPPAAFSPLSFFFFFFSRAFSLRLFLPSLLACGLCARRFPHAFCYFCIVFMLRAGFSPRSRLFL